MDIGALFLLLALLILIALFVSRPFFVRQPAATLQEEHIASTLLAERDRILNALQELDFDYALGKIPAEDYPAQRGSLLQRGAAILRQLDALSPISGPEESAEDRLEADIASRRADAAVKSASVQAATDEDLEALIAKRRAVLKDKAAGFCPKCGHPILSSDSFCPQCGYALK
jgi:RNA polymerase-binding transcription factor DksA